MNHAPNDNFHAASDADLARLYVDGELTGEARQEFDARLAAEPSLCARVEAERRLKQRVVNLMRDSAPVPAGLAAHVQAALDEVTDPAELAPPVAGVITPESGESHDAPGEQSAADAPRRSFFTGPSRANIFAVAASLLIVGSVVLVGIFGPTINDLGGGPGVTVPNDLISRAARHIDGEHSDCTTNTQYITDKLSMPASALHNEIARHLGVPDICEFDFSSAGYHFVGAGSCGVPGAMRSAHLLYAHDADRVMFSIFLVPDQNQYRIGGQNMRFGEWYTVMEPTEATKAVYAFSDGELVYFITACIPSHNAGLARLIQEQLRGAP